MSACNSMISISFLRTSPPVLSASRRTSSGTLIQRLPRFWVDRSGPARRSRHEPRVVLDGLHALVHRECVVDAHPFARVPHEIEGKLAAAEWFHPGELRLERGREGVRAWAGIDREEVEVIPEPLRTDVGDVVQLLPFLRRLNILGPQHVFDQISSSRFDLGLDRGGYGG